MAKEQKKTQAQKTASGKTTKKNASKSSNAKAKTQEVHTQLPVRLITSVASLFFFIVLLVMSLQPEGALIVALQTFLLGLIGKTAFYVAIPALLYLFIIQAFSGKKPVILRSVCLLSFIFLVGCISQLFMNSNLPSGFAIVSALFEGGSDGTTAGLICGGVALVFKALLGSWISRIIMICVAVFLLLASFNITIPSIIRAVQNRPRADWEDEESEQREEPAAVVVNHLATKHIEHTEQRRQRKAERAEQDIIRAAERAAEAEAARAASTPRKKESKVDELMRQIGSDVESPVAAAEKPMEGDANVILS